MRSSDINRVYAKGRFGGSTHLQVKVLQTHLPSARAAVVVSRKVSGKAVVRNRIRRRLSELLSSRWEDIAPGYDIVVTVRADLSEAPAPDLKRELTSGLIKTGVLKEKHV